MSTLFDDLKEGLEEAIIYESGSGAGEEKTFVITPVIEYTKEEIRDIRMKAGMTQRVFACYMGVSRKTVEAWEGGRSHPAGPVFRLLGILAADDSAKYVISRTR